jgi:hypothetical protein
MRHIPRLILLERVHSLQERHIGESIMLLKLLPHQLVAERHAGALVAFLDFCKAYDSVNRECVKRGMVALGLGNELVSWMMSLLSQNTTACAVLNGLKSNKRRFQAGV